MERSVSCVGEAENAVPKRISLQDDTEEKADRAPVHDEDENRDPENDCDLAKRIDYSVRYLHESQACQSSKEGEGKNCFDDRKADTVDSREIKVALSEGWGAGGSAGAQGVHRARLGTAGLWRGVPLSGLCLRGWFRGV